MISLQLKLGSCFSYRILLTRRSAINFETHQPRNWRRSRAERRLSLHLRRVLLWEERLGHSLSRRNSQMTWLTSQPSSVVIILSLLLRCQPLGESQDVTEKRTCILMPSVFLFSFILTVIISMYVTNKLSSMIMELMSLDVNRSIAFIFNEIFRFILKSNI